jgi:hypothetical protein
LAGVASASTPRGEIDDLDLALLRELALDARLSRRALARAVGMLSLADAEPDCFTLALLDQMRRARSADQR